MLTVEYKVNGSLIGFTTIHNLCQKRDVITNLHTTEEHRCIYGFDHRPVVLRGVTAGLVKHNQTDGFEVLVSKVLKKITRTIKE